jgi:phosphoglucomutase
MPGRKEIRMIGEETDRIYLDQVKEMSLSPEVVKKHNDLKIVFTPIHGAAVRSLSQWPQKHTGLPI